MDLRRIAEYVYQAIRTAKETISRALDKARAKVEAARVRARRAFAKVREWTSGKI